MAEDRKTRDVAADIVDINTTLRDIMKREQMALSGDSLKRGEELIRIHNQYSTSVQADGQNLFQMKKPSQSVYDFMVNSLLGPNGENRSGQASLTGNKERDKWVNRDKLEKLFTTSDSQMASYFLSTNSDIMHIYDEIDSVCAYFYQLDEAIDCIRDSVFNAEQPGQTLNIDIEFPGVIDSSKLTEYREHAKESLNYCDFAKKLRDHIGPKAIKYGTYYVMIVPFKEVGVQMAYLDRNTLSSSGVTHMVYEGSGDEEPDKEAIVENCKVLLESFDRPEEEIKEHLEIISENLDGIFICEDNTPPNVTGMMLRYGTGMSEDLQKMADAAIKEHVAKVNKNYKSRSDSGYKDGVIDEKDVEQIQGCSLTLVDPRQMVPVKIFDYTLGYYYFENYDFSKMGTTLTDIMSNQLNFTQRNMVVDNIVNSVIRNLKFKDLVEGNQELRTMIMNCILYAQRRNNPIRVKFVPSEYVVAFNTNTDQNGNGQPVLLRSLFYARLYTSLLLFNMTAIITKSTDSEFYYMRESALDAQYQNQAADLIDQFQDSNIDLVAIANGNLLHGNRAINKRYYMSMGTSDIRPFDMEVVSGQQIDIHNDFLTDLKKMAIGATSVPAVMVDFMEEVEYATMLGLVNIRHLKRCNMIAQDFDGPITDVLRNILKWNQTSIPGEILQRMECHLRQSNTLQNNITSQQLGDVTQTATTMVETWMMGQDSQPPEDQAFFKEEMVKALVIQMSSAAPWDLLESIADECRARARTRSLEYKARTANANANENQ